MRRTVRRDKERPTACISISRLRLTVKKSPRSCELSGGKHFQLTNSDRVGSDCHQSTMGDGRAE